MVSGRVPILIDVKGGVDVVYAQFLTKSIKNYKGEIAIQSNHPLMVFILSHLNSKVPVGQVSWSYDDHPTVTGLMKFLLSDVSLNVLSKPDFVTYGLYKIDSDRLKRLKKQIGDRPILLWTIKSSGQLSVVEECRCNYLFEDQSAIGL